MFYQKNEISYKFMNIKNIEKFLLLSYLKSE